MPTLFHALIANLLEESTDEMNIESKNALKLQYGIRQFEIETATMNAIKCPICTKITIVPGIFLETEVRSETPSIHCKFIYELAITNQTKNAISKSYVRIYANAATPRIQNGCSHAYTRLYDVCKLCNGNIKATGPNIPKFSLLGGFDFGIPVPACMIGLSFAEQSMLARIQVVICFSTLPNGSQKAKGSAGFIDRSDFAMQVATRLPWHPSCNASNLITACIHQWQTSLDSIEI